MLPALNREAIRSKHKLDAAVPIVSDLAKSLYQSVLQALLFTLLLAVILSLFNGLVTIMLAALSASLGHPPLNLTTPLTLTNAFSLSAVTRLVDVTPTMLLTLMEEILDLPMDLLVPALRLSTFLPILPTELGPFNGLGSVEPFLSEITTRASTTLSLVELLDQHPYQLS